jgi:hypothetical protein
MGRDIAIPCRRHCLYANTVDGVSGTAKGRALSAEAGMRRAAMFLIQIVALQPAANRPAGQGGRRRCAWRCGRPQYLAMQGIRGLMPGIRRSMFARQAQLSGIHGGGLVYRAFEKGCHNLLSHLNTLQTSREVRHGGGRSADAAEARHPGAAASGRAIDGPLRQPLPVRRA